LVSGLSGLVRVGRAGLPTPRRYRAGGFPLAVSARGRRFQPLPLSCANWNRGRAEARRRDRPPRPRPARRPGPGRGTGHVAGRHLLETIAGGPERCPTPNCWPSARRWSGSPCRSVWGYGNSGGCGGTA